MDDSSTTPPHPIDLSSFDAIVFDLGGVILPLFPEASERALSKMLGKAVDDLYSKLEQDEIFNQMDRGEFSAEEFRAQVIAKLKTDVPISDALFDEAWCAPLGTIPPENVLFLHALRKEKRTFVLSNTNEIHIERFLADYNREHARTWGPFASLFEHVHYSHELGMRKPEPRAYEAVLRRHQLTAERTVFLDDKLENVEAACAVSMRGILHPRNAHLPSRFVNKQES